MDIDGQARRMDAASLKEDIVHHLFYTLGKDSYTATPRDWFTALACAVRDRLVERWMQTMRRYYEQDRKRVYYLSLEYLPGRMLMTHLQALGIEEAASQAMEGLGLDLAAAAATEPEPGLGNGGLGRLASCLLDSMATLGLPGYGYGIRYEYGLFHQRIEDGQQVEQPDNWLRYGNPWEFPRPELLYPVRFGGQVHEGEPLRFYWTGGEIVMAMAYDLLIPGYRNGVVNTLRLWSAKASREFDLRLFNAGQYFQALEAKVLSENLSRVLYPDDTTDAGLELRLKQEYFFVSATLQDALARFFKYHRDLGRLPEKVALQINDTHPSLAILELMRLLVDQHAIPWEKAWDITVQVCAYTNHTLMPEALETWPVALFGRILPRHLQILYEINHRFLKEVRRLYPGDVERVRRVSLVDLSQCLRMAHLSVVGSHRVNGVSELHTHLLRTTYFADFDELFPGRIIAIPNGITPRFWLRRINPALSRLLDGFLGESWVTDLDRLKDLAALAEDSACQDAFQDVCWANKAQLAEYIHRALGLDVEVDTLFDVQVKRIHEYKRQLLNLLHAVTLYQRMREDPQGDFVPRTVIFAGKAAPGYAMAKLIIRLIHDVAEVVNGDPAVGGRLKVVFLPNYNVSLAETVIPAADLSEQLSMAGTEASGTGNMKFALNGALTIGTFDGANVDILKAVGEENFFRFGMKAEDIRALRARGYDPQRHLEACPPLKRALEAIASGFFSPEAPGRYLPLVESLLREDRFMVLADFPDYLRAQERVEALYRDPFLWSQKALLNIASMGFFSSDRAVGGYREVWGL
ncbi:MAG: glycogen/starch/alpha-glucan phosphorylase [Gammaproteobacteria bacterium]|nr:MAG: glycogen/starch/alpha-glucan phosphorylase [Gammaproteobacteria bacterium]